MPKQYLIEFTERAQIAYHRLSPSMRQKVDNMLDQVQSHGLRSPNITMVRSPRRMYLARVGSDFRVVLLPEGDVIRVLDIASHDKIQRLYHQFDWNP